MPSTFTTRSRLTKQATGENTNTWGLILNVVIDLIDAAMDGVTTISSGGATSLTTANGSSDQARTRFLNITAATAAAITIPSLEKWYIVRNASSSVNHTITNGASTVTIYAGELTLVATNGTTVWKLVPNDFPTPTRDSQAATKAYADALAFEAVELPGQAGNAGKFVTTDGTNASWGYPFGSKPTSTITTNYTAVAGDILSCNTASGAFTVTLPASPSAGARVVIKDGNATLAGQGFAGNALTVARNGQTINGNAEDVIFRTKGLAVTFDFKGTTWEVSLGC